MRVHRRILFWLGLLLALIGLVRWWGSSGRLQGRDVRTPAPAQVPVDAQQAKVARIVDGDTVIVKVDVPGPIPVGDDHRIRVLEIDTPETVRPNHPVECGGTAATSFAASELPVGTTVYLVADRQDKDGYGRFLRYVWDSQGEFYNEKAVSEGYARAVLYQPNDRYIDRIKQAETAAKRESRGIWGRACAAAQ